MTIKSKSGSTLERYEIKASQWKNATLLWKHCRARSQKAFRNFKTTRHCRFSLYNGTQMITFGSIYAHLNLDRESARLGQSSEITSEGE